MLGIAGLRRAEAKCREPSRALQMDKIIGAGAKAVSKMTKKDDEEKEDGGDGDKTPTTSPVTPSVTNEALPPRAAPFATPQHA